LLLKARPARAAARPVLPPVHRRVVQLPTRVAADEVRAAVAVVAVVVVAAAVAAVVVAAGVITRMQRLRLRLHAGPTAKSA
jgi:hypothetical protein